MALGDILRRDHAGSYGTCRLGRMEVLVMKPLLPWIAVPLLLLGAAMLIAHFGASGLWIAGIGAGIALVAIIGQIKSRAAGR
jgi:uncharacterized membrane protein